MEIDIPSLDDVLFEDACRWCYGHIKDCGRCAGTGEQLTPVGERLVKFLEARGVTLTAKVKE